MTIKEVSDAWMIDKRQYVKKSSIASYMHLLKMHLLPEFGDKQKLTEDEVQAFALKKLKDGMSTKTLRDALVVLKMVVRFGEKKQWLEHMDWKVLFPANQRKATLPVLTKSNQKKLMEYLEHNFSFFNLGLMICLSTGLRIGEICALKWEDVNLENGTVFVNKTIERVPTLAIEGRRTEIIIGPPKTRNSYREIPLSKELIRTIKALTKVVSRDFFILTNSETPTEPRNYRNYFNRLTEQIGIPHIKFHGLRHSFATRCIESHCDYKTVSVLLGHSDISTTLNTYVHPNEDQKRDVIEKMMRSIR